MAKRVSQTFCSKYGAATRFTTPVMVSWAMLWKAVVNKNINKVNIFFMAQLF
jgi:hypothetical protein